MARILSIDYGLKRVGLAVTDPLQLIANGLDTVATEHIFDYLKKYLETEEVSCFVVGEPFHLDGNPAQITPQINGFIKKLQKLFPDIKVERQDERFTSVEAKKVMIQAGVKKKKRRD
ncbi:MAG: Holliday junction resolvase RuvX, partial [Bacteroidota bacterium]